MTNEERSSHIPQACAAPRPEGREAFDATLARMLQAIDGKSQEDLAAFLDISKDAIYKAGRARKIPPAWFLTIGKKAAVSLDWLVTGEGAMRRGGTRFTADAGQEPERSPQGAPRWIHPEAAPAMGYTLVPKVRARLCAGTGSLETEGDVVGLYAFKTSFLRRKGCPQKMVMMDIVGDSMEPVLMESDSVLIDESQNAIISGGIFAVGIDSNVLVKYIDALPGKIVLRSRNSSYGPIEVDMSGDLADMVRIIGRVVWSCREYVR